MTIEDIELAELTQGERSVLAEDRERWKRMGAGSHLDDWLAFGPGLVIRRSLAMKIAFTNRPEGRGYSSAFKDLMEHDGLAGMDKTSITAVLWLHDNPEHMGILREIRGTMKVGERARLNSPITARQRVEKVIKLRQGGAEETKKKSPVSILKQQVAEQNRKIAHLEEQLHAAETDGSLFDLKHDTAANIAATIVANISATKAGEIARQIRTALKAKTAHAG